MLDSKNMLLPQTGILPCRIWSLLVELYEHTYIHTYIQGRSQDFFLYPGEGNIGPKGRSPPAWPRAEMGLLGRTQPAPPHQLWHLGERCISSPSGVRGGTPAAKRFSSILSVQSGLSRRFIVVYRSLFELFHSSNFCQGKSYEKQPRRLQSLVVLGM